MPKVGDKHFGYGPQGIAAAQAESARTGIPMENMKQYRHGGAVSVAETHATRGSGKTRKPCRHRIVRMG